MLGHSRNQPLEKNFKLGTKEVYLQHLFPPILTKEENSSHSMYLDPVQHTSTALLAAINSSRSDSVRVCVYVCAYICLYEAVSDFER